MKNNLPDEFQKYLRDGRIKKLYVDLKKIEDEKWKMTKMLFDEREKSKRRGWIYEC
jgi:hypothetical protein